MSTSKPRPPRNRFVDHPIPNRSVVANKLYIPVPGDLLIRKDNNQWVLLGLERNKFLPFDTDWLLSFSLFQRLEALVGLHEILWPIFETEEDRTEFLAAELDPCRTNPLEPRGCPGNSSSRLSKQHCALSCAGTTHLLYDSYFTRNLVHR